MQPITRRQALACGALTLAATADKSAGPTPGHKPEIDAVFRNALQAFSVPGVAAGIVRDGKVIYLEGHGVKKLGTDEKITPYLLFPIASCTKAFTTAALAMQVSQRRMSWDDPVRNYLDYFRLADPSADRLVTLRDLVCHRTGLGSHDLLWYRAAWTPRDAVRRIGRVPLDLQFRSSFQYQSTMVAAAGYALEAALGEGKTWEGFVREQILKPLGMTRTFCTTTEAASKDRATPHKRGRDDTIRPIDWYENKLPDPAGSIVSCAADLCQWALFHLNEGKAVQNGKEIALLSPAALAETHSPQNLIPLPPGSIDFKLQLETDHMAYCMGWVRQDYKGKLLWSHGGTIDGFRTHITLVPKERLGIVLLNNLDGTDMNLAISNTLLDLLLNLPRRDWNKYIGAVAKERADAKKQSFDNREKLRRKGTKPSRDLAAYQGSYLEPAFGLARVTLENGTLIWEWSTFKCPLEHYHFDTFIAKSEQLGDPFVNFGLGLDGNVVTMNAVERYFMRVRDK